MGYMILLFFFMLNLPLSQASDADIPPDTKEYGIFPYLNNENLEKYRKTNKGNKEHVEAYKKKAGINKSIKLWCASGQKVGKKIYEALHSKSGEEIKNNIKNLHIKIEDREWQITALDDDLIHKLFDGPEAFEGLRLSVMLSGAKNQTSAQEYLRCQYDLDKYAGSVVTLDRPLDKSSLRIKGDTCEFFDPTLKKTSRLEKYPFQISFVKGFSPSLDATEGLEVTCEQEFRDNGQ